MRKMKMRRFNFQNIPDIGESFFGDEEQLLHFHVLRLKKNDTIEAFDGTGYIYELKISNIDSNKIEFIVIKKNKGKEIPIKAVAFIAELKNDAMDQSISILAEYGIPEIIPFFAERSIPKLDKKKIIKKQERRQKIAIESVKKVGGIYHSKVHKSVILKEIKNFMPLFSEKILFWENESSGSNRLINIDYSKNIAFFIGPEGGFTSNEISELINLGGMPYSLGSRILRAPQAAATAATLIRYFTENTIT